MATFRQLRIFLAVSENSSFTVASEVLGISQAAVSKQVAALENNLGYSLFHRTRGRISCLTPQGEHLLQHLPSLLSQSEILWQAPSEVTEPRKVRIACPDLLAEIINENLWHFYDEYRHIEVDILQVPTTHDSLGLMHAKGIDLFYLTTRSLPADHQVKHICTVTTGIFASSKNPLLCHWQPNTHLELPVIFSLSNSSLSRELQQNLEGNGITPYYPAAHVPNFTTMLNLALQGTGALISVDHAVQKYVDNGELIRLNLPSDKLERYSVINPNRAHLQEVQLVDGFIRSILMQTPQTHCVAP